MRMRISMPLFFVASGMTLDAMRSPPTRWLVFVVLLIVVRGLRLARSCTSGAVRSGRAG